MEFAGNERYQLVRRLGEGAFGVVFEPIDRERGARVALKTLTRLEPAALYRFKKEFRALADAAHPNLVELYELSSCGDDWFFTMERVDGVDWLTHARAGMAVDDTLPWAGVDHAAADEDADDRVWLETDNSLDQPPRWMVGPVGMVPRIGAVRVDVPRLRAALAQLADAVATIHRAGIVHRDIKPSNVLVDHAGRVVLVDFGIATHLEVRARGATDAELVLGTPEYMAPEQSSGEPVGAAADWYAVGVMLYETLTGRLPFERSLVKMLFDKERGDDPPRPRQIDPTVPEDLDALCAELLRRRTEARPTDAEVLDRLGVGSASGRARRDASDPAVGAGFVGREDARRVLGEALDDARRGAPAQVLIEGGSGTGKSALCRAFFDWAAENAGALVIAGRCYEREAVPYNAFDAAVDALSAFS
jgi:serine/threonine protein kinase